MTDVPYDFIDGDGDDESHDQEPVEELNSLSDEEVSRELGYLFGEIIIEWPTALEDPRGRERDSNFYVGADVDRGPVQARIDARRNYDTYPCCFCNPPSAVEERGIVPAELELVNEDGIVLGFCCKTCISGAPEVDSFDENGEQEDPEEGRGSLLDRLTEWFRS